jgi:hypothetical protein
MTFEVVEPEALRKALLDETRTWTIFSRVVSAIAALIRR